MDDPQPTAALTRSDGLRVTAFRIGKMIPLPFVGQPTEALLTRAPTGGLLHRKKTSGAAAAAPDFTFILHTLSLSRRSIRRAGTLC